MSTTLAAFHAALNTLDVSKFDEFRAHEHYVMTINPRDKAVAIGWDAVRQIHEATFASGPN